MLLYSDHGDLDMCKLFDIKIKDLSVTLKMLNEKHVLGNFDFFSDSAM